MSPDDAAAALQSRLGDSVTEVTRFRDEVAVVVAKARLIDTALILRDELGFDHLSDITAVDWLGREPRFDVVYHFYSFSDRVWLRVKTRTNEGEPVDSVIPLYPCANWAEREVYDLFGITFDGHPKLERILMPLGWVGHPLRKDYPTSQIVLPRSGLTKIPD